jgi:hypothetical protein
MKKRFLSKNKTIAAEKRIIADIFFLNEYNHNPGRKINAEIIETLKWISPPSL